MDMFWTPLEDSVHPRPWLTHCDCTEMDEKKRENTRKDPVRNSFFIPVEILIKFIGYSY